MCVTFVQELILEEEFSEKAKQVIEEKKARLEPFEEEADTNVENDSVKNKV